MSTSRADVSVIIPAYNAAAYLDAAIASVLKQTAVPTEIIVVDDGSTDDTLQIARQPRAHEIVVIANPHRGIAATRNHGIRQATARHLAFLDADDLWPADKIARQLAHIDATPGLDGVFGAMRNFLSPELAETERARLHCPETPVPGYSAGTLLIRREAFLSVGLFDESLSAGEFIAWYSAALDQGLNFEMSEHILLHRRIHGRNTTAHNVEQRNADYLRVVRAHVRAKAARAAGRSAS